MEEGQPGRRVLSRRRFLQCAAAAGAAVAAGGLPSLGTPSASLPPEEGDRGRSAAPVRLPGLPGADWLRRWTLPSNAYRAVLSYDAQQAHLYRPRCVPGDTAPLYLEAHDPAATTAVAFVWPFSQATAATLDLLGLPPGYGDYRNDVHDRLYAGLPRYWDGAAYAPGATPAQASDGVWYDDNAWIGLDLVRAHRLTGDAAALSRAEAVFDFITTGWKPQPQDHAPGGIYWVRGNPNRHRNTCSNGPSAELALRLHQLTGKDSYLAWAKKVYGWVSATLRAEDGLYWDHIDHDGSIDRTVRSYNQGTMVGAGALLYRCTGDRLYLEQAKETAAAALAYFGNQGYGHQPPAFNAIFFRNLLYFATVDNASLPATLAAMQGYADDAWLNSRSANGLFPFPDEQPVHTLLHQAGMVQIYACLAWDIEKYDLLV